MEVRVQKFLADEGICSRRQGETLIEEGRVTVNGQLAELGQKVEPGRDHVVVDGRRIQHKDRPPVTVVVHKPRGYICSNDDPGDHPTVFELLPADIQRERLFCAGRLDLNSEGLLVLTNDGDLANRLMHPSNEVVKRYRVTLSRDLDPKHISILERGIVHEGEKLIADRVIPSKGENAARRCEVHIHQGRKREIRRMFETLGYFVKRLQRVQIGGYAMRALAPGEYRKVGQKEITMMLAQPRDRRP